MTTMKKKMNYAISVYVSLNKFLSFKVHIFEIWSSV